MVLVQSRLQNLIREVWVSKENAPVFLVYQYVLQGVATACLLGIYGLLHYFPVLS